MLGSSAKRKISSAQGFQYRSLQVTRKNSEPFDGRSSSGGRRDDGSIGRRALPSPESRLMQGTFSSSQKKKPQMNRSLIIQPHPTLPSEGSGRL